MYPLSHLTQVRGLKCKQEKALMTTHRSHLTQVRGLKSSTNLGSYPISVVAPHAGAWIEIVDLIRSVIRLRSRTSRRCVD